MLESSLIGAYLGKLSPEQLQAAFVSLLPEDATRAQRLAAIETALHGPGGRLLRAEMGRWIVQNLIPVECLVPDSYASWRPPVRDAMLFVSDHLSVERLAPKLLEQIELPPNTSPEKRLLCLIAKVPGLQKLGQVIARNRHLRPALRTALAVLENGIRDVDAEGVAAIIRRQLGTQLDRFEVRLDRRNLSEASVSAVLRFTWLDPLSGRRERGVFKVLKPHIPACFAEDMELLAQIARFFARRHREYGAAARVIPDTFNKVRRLLQSEVNFPREQRTLVEAAALYRTVRGVRVPRLIPELCTRTITAISEESGTKITDAAARLPASRRGRIADQVIDALLGVPLFAAGEHSLFHADPHAGNLLYDSRRGELIVLDWALRETLNREQRRHLALLFVAVALRDPIAASAAIAALAQSPLRKGSPKDRMLQARVREFLDAVPLRRLPNAVDAMDLLQQIAMRGIRFPASLIMLAKVLFTLDGILRDIGGDGSTMGLVLARHVARRWITDRRALTLPLGVRDWAAVQCSALFYGSRLLLKGEEEILARLLPAPAAAKAAS